MDVPLALIAVRAKTGDRSCFEATWRHNGAQLTPPRQADRTPFELAEYQTHAERRSRRS